MNLWLGLAVLSLGSPLQEPPAANPPAQQRRSTDGMSEAAARSRIVHEARTFMHAYARDLRNGDRAALADLYSRYGAWRLTADSAAYYRQDWEQIRAAFAAPQWRPPARFDWFMLDFQTVGPDTVVVIAAINLGGSPGPALTHLYSALLIREEGVFRIRMEHLAPAPPRPAP